VSVRRKSTPSYLHHKQSGRGRAVWTDALGVRQQKLLPGEFDSPESRTAFAKLHLELVTSPLSGCQLTPATISVNEVLLAHLDHAERHYRRGDGSLTHEVDEYRLICRYVRELYGTTPAAEFGPLALKVLRQKFIAVGWCRSLVNQRVGRVRRIFKWAASEQLVPAAVPQALGTVQGLLKGRTAVRESPPVGPVADAVVDATLPFLSRHARGLVEFQRLTGCRPGEACALRWCDLDTSGAVWVYRPPHHKTAWRGKSRTIAIGPKAQRLLEQFRTADPTAHVFCPSVAVTEFHAGRGAKRKTPPFPSHMARNAGKRKANPERAPTAAYTASSYGHAVVRACDRAFPPPPPLARREEETEAAWWGRLTAEQKEEVEAWRKAHRWHPNQLRHLFATAVRKEHGLEAAQVLLGHARADVTQVYAERDEELATLVAAAIG
jgi:integrase